MLSSVRQRVRSLLRSWRGKGVLAATLAAFLVVAVVAVATPPTISASLDLRAIPPQELVRVAALLEEGDRSESPESGARWIPAEASDRTIGLLVQHLRANPGTPHWADLRRAGESPDLGVLNTAVDELAVRLADTPPSEFAQVTDDEARTRLQIALRGNASAVRVRPAPPRPVPSKADIAAAVAPAVSPGPPPPPNWWRWTACSLVGQRIDDHDRWCEAVYRQLTEKRQEVEALGKRYRAAGRVTDIDLARLGDADLVATPVADGARGTPRVAWKDGSAALDCDLSIRTQTVRGTRSQDTGIRLLGVPVGPVADNTVGLHWPPAACVVDEQKLRAFLRGNGFPANLHLRDVQVRMDRGASAASIGVSFRTESADFPGWREEARLDISSRSVSRQVAELGASALASFKRFAATTSRIGPNHVHVQ